MVSKKAGKQRQAQTDAPIHVRRKRIRARLITDDPDLTSIRSVTVRVGDEVEVLRQALDRHELERELFRQAAETLGTPGENKAGPLSPDQESKLRALGYIE